MSSISCFHIIIFITLFWIVQLEKCFLYKCMWHLVQALSRRHLFFLSLVSRDFPDDVTYNESLHSSHVCHTIILPESRHTRSGFSPLLHLQIMASTHKARASLKMQTSQHNKGYFSTLTEKKYHFNCETVPPGENRLLLCMERTQSTLPSINVTGV